MDENKPCPREIEEEFVNLAMGISDYFPELDLRFNHIEGTGRVRCIAPELSENALELVLGSAEPQSVVYDAVLSIKALGKFFDA